jgi:hypothetical protein
VGVNVINQAFSEWPQCLSVCNQEKAQADLKAQACDGELPSSINQTDVLQKKIDSMKAKRKELETWTSNRMVTVNEMTNVIDCFADSLPRRYNSMAYPQMRSAGFDKMPLHNECRLHGCEAKQCLRVKKPCRVPIIFDQPEALCQIYEPNGTYECVDKIGIMANNPMSLGFGITWMVVGAIFACCSVATWVRVLEQRGQLFAGAEGP